MITIKEIAELAGVSRGTVDRVVHNRGLVKKEIQEKILKIIEETNYRPNIIAKALANKQYNKKKILIILNSIDNPFYIDVIQGIKDKYKFIEEFGFELIFDLKKGYNVTEQLESIENAKKNGMDGIIITPINDIKISNKLNELFNEGIPIVNLNIDVEKTKKLAFVGSDFFKAGEVAASLFGMAMNDLNKNILIVTGSKKNLGHNLRIKGFEKIINKKYQNIHILDILENQDDDDISFSKIDDYLSNNNFVDGIFFCGEGIEGGLKALKRKNLLKKIKVITVDLTPEVKKNLKYENILATICQEPYRQGELSLEIIFDYLIQKKEPNTKTNYTKTEIIIKENLI